MSAKYPRTPHLPWSPGASADDKRLSNADHLLDRRIVITEKLDGSNLCLERDAIYARSHSGPPTHRSFDAAKAMHSYIRTGIEPGFSLFGEWCYAVHSIVYDELPDHFFLFAIRDPAGKWLSWEDVETYAKLNGYTTVPVVAGGSRPTADLLKYTTDVTGRQPSRFGGIREGVVVRLHDGFEDFGSSVAKWVRKDHVQTDDHWKSQPIRKQNVKLPEFPS